MSDPNTWFYRGAEAAQSEADPALRSAAIERLLQTTSRTAERACRDGCAFCCHLPVVVSTTEVEQLTTYLRHALTAQNLESLRHRIAGEADWRRGRGRESIASARRRCPLLDARDRCVAYDARPLACRALFSFDREACAQDHEAAVGDSPINRHTPPPPYDGEAWAASRGAMATDDYALELTVALDDALTSLPPPGTL